jgi:hypothetical protein
MTQEEKELLLKDLCGRLPYGVKAYVRNWSKLSQKYYEDIYVVKSTFPSLNEVHVQTERSSVDVLLGYDDYKIKPYLFPLSSMSEDQKYEFYLRFIVKDCDCVFDYFKFCLDNGKWHKLLTSLLAVEEIIDWFHKNHIDYRGLIPMGLAEDATGLDIY